jgi:O-antigen/teichoic acid export membrane protein
MYLVLIKFVEVFTRAAFVVGTSYSLSLAGGGQFGIAVTLIGLFAFAFNWERQVDIQRRFVNASPAVFDRAIVSAVQFWGFNQLVLMPVFLLTCHLMAGLSTWQLLLAAVIVSGEHVANQTYQMALISRRYWHFISIVAGKNALVLLAVLPWVLFAPSKLTLDLVLTTWAGAQLLCVGVVFGVWLRVKQNLPHAAPFSWRDRIFRQHRDSFTHFQIGLVAIVMLQLDRLMVGTLLRLDQAGLYFRHVLIVSFLYQFFSVAFYNRALPAIFSEAKRGSLIPVKRRIVRELAVVFALVIGAILCAIALDLALGHAVIQKYHLSIPLALMLVGGALARGTADLIGAICHARMREVLILRAQTIALVTGIVLQVAFSISFGVFGTAAASSLASLLYLVLAYRAVHSFRDGAF